MAYINAEDVNHIRVALKKEFPQYKFSVTRDHHLGVNINFMKGPRFAEYEYLVEKRDAANKAMIPIIHTL